MHICVQAWPGLDSEHSDFLLAAVAGINVHRMQSNRIDEQAQDVGTTWTVGTYNVLHPAYALKHKVTPGLDSEGCSNWSIRANAIATYIMEAQLDIYLLQEVGWNELPNLMCSLSCDYIMTFYGHPSRSDGTAVLTQRRRLEVVARQAVPLPHASKQAHMCATCVFARDLRSHLLLAIVSAHLDPNCEEHEGTIVKFLEQCHREQDCHATILGGDFNQVYSASGQGPPGFQHVPGGQGTFKDRQIDWIIFSSDLLGLRGDPTPEKFIASSQQVLSSSGHMASDHTAEAVALSYTGVLLANASAEGWAGSGCEGCGRLASGGVLHICCDSCPDGHTDQCDQRSRCRHGCGRFLNAPYRSCCMRCPGRHTEQCEWRQDNLRRTASLHSRCKGASEEPEEEPEDEVKAKAIKTGLGKIGNVYG